MYLITFHSNFDANMFNKKMSPYGALKRKPVPRELSSSCGTCFEFTPSVENYLDELNKQNYESIYEFKDNKYTLISSKE